MRILGAQYFSKFFGGKISKIDRVLVEQVKAVRTMF